MARAYFHAPMRAAPAIVMFCGFVIVFVPFFVQISAVARLVAHSGALAEERVLPPTAGAWSAGGVKRSLAAIALRNPDLEQLYPRLRRDGADGNTATGDDDGLASRGPAPRLLPGLGIVRARSRSNVGVPTQPVTQSL